MRQLQPGFRKSRSSASDHHRADCYWATSHTQEMTEKDQETSVEDENQRMQGDLSAELGPVQAWRTDMQRHTYALLPLTAASFLPSSLKKAAHSRPPPWGTQTGAQVGWGPKAQLAFRSRLQLVRSWVSKTTTMPS